MGAKTKFHQLVFLSVGVGPLVLGELRWVPLPLGPGGGGGLRP